MTREAGAGFDCPADKVSHCLPESYFFVSPCRGACSPVLDAPVNNLICATTASWSSRFTRLHPTGVVSPGLALWSLYASVLPAVLPGKPFPLCCRGLYSPGYVLGPHLNPSNDQPSTPRPTPALRFTKSVLCTACSVVSAVKPAPWLRSTAWSAPCCSPSREQPI